ncbi:Bug family tripartite tricarboxylate transporter substrate binding protein [Streptomyces harbinensis]|uniref:Bug family tripartite tricarboxylate transporter substrate binding protein n=1 Tax=Streptomyces harbinensis TaxID=1176198 RepID=UPI00159227F3|nr:tripartite tricarboxylate transporter substrate binding protein [Streptomyces harbinensis]QKV68717.1 tripartite tricarboxylate transporter substrate binding protein [Streptomyces harbinensis]
MSTSRRTLLTGGMGALGGLLLGTAGCAASGPVPHHELRLMVPNTPGGGYDYTARTLAVTLSDTELVDAVEVFNLTGGSGTVALTRLVHEAGNGRLLLQMGLGLVGSVNTHAELNPTRIADATPVARLMDEAEAVIVAPDSPYRSLAALTAAWRDGGLRAGTGSRPGGPDHLALMLTAEAAGIAPDEVRYSVYDGGGGLLAALLSHDVDFVMSGVSEYRHAIATGELRVLAVTGEQRLAGIDAPTLRESGFDLAVTNWRGLLAPPGLAERDLAETTAVLDALHATTQWRRALRDNGWSDAYLTGDAFGRFLAAEDQRVGRLLRTFPAGAGAGAEAGSGTGAGADQD